MQIQYSDRELTIDGVQHVLDRRIISAATDGQRVFVVFDYMSYPRDRAALNLVALDQNAKLIWTVTEQPTDSPIAAYVNIISVAPLTVGNWAAYDCVLDAQSGALILSLIHI